MSEKIDDQTLVQQLQKGNVDAFDSLFEEYSHRMFGFAMKYFKNETGSEELVQEVFVKVWGNRKSLKTEHSFKSYLFTIALNQVRKHFNKKAISLRYLESLKHETEQSVVATIQTEDYEVAVQQLNVLISQMPPRRQEIFRKSKLEGKSSKEIAAELNISPGTVDNQVSEALRFLRQRIKPENISILLFLMLFLF
jgi:RNA polymerase sigma-70 factor (ECF subfamily)